MKQLSYETRLASNLSKLEPGKWFSITGRPDYDQLVQCIKDWIDVGCPFEFSDDYTRIKVCEPVTFTDW